MCRPIHQHHEEQPARTSSRRHQHASSLAVWGPSVRIVTLPLSIRRRSNKTILPNLLCVARTSLRELVFKTSAGTSDVVGHRDGRHVFHDKEFHHGGLDEHDHCWASGAEDCLVMSSFFSCTIWLNSACSSVYDIAANSLHGLDDHVFISAVSPFCRKSDVIPLFICCLSQSFMSDCVYAHLILLVLEVALHDGSAIMLLREIHAFRCSFEFCLFCRVSKPSTLLNFLQC